MKQFAEFIPLIIFFVVYKTVDIYAATGALMAATCVQMLVQWLRHKKLEKMHLVTLVLVLFFGGLTMFFQDDAFIKWKVTAVNALFAAGLLVSRYGFGKNLIKQMLGKEMPLPDAIWDRANLAWVGFFAFCGALNVYVAFYLSQEFWVNFKVFGLLGLTLAFTFATAFYLYRQLPAQDGTKQEGQP
ncbi:septation protein A [Zobellella denitrificans]|uniref:Inner membrane-spanning protein YciB n=1 Tax=Zobellella denitrificans TaxID=347534 RepID=A0A231N5H5_9GAMM|nr:septation protein A [Zobellella denitrificans]ATG73572.1 intracellular septation protein A [Zobellella denitrificans]OXS17086.1 septation protein A [Zobellella denitrificans]